MPYYYRIYGLQIESNLALKGLFPGQSNTKPDLFFDWYKDESELFNPNLEWRQKDSPGGKDLETVSFWEAETPLGSFLKLRYAIDDTYAEIILDQNRQRISIIKPEHLRPGRLKSYLLGSVMSSILRERGIICLHASVVEINGNAVAFAGPKSAGKSTTAAALAKHGASILTDDIAVITSTDSKFHVQPGYMYLRLLANSVDAVYGEDNNRPDPETENSKYHIRLGQTDNNRGAFMHEPMPLACIFLLTPRTVSATSTTVSLVEPKDRFMALFNNVYGFYLDKDSTYANEFKTLGRLANATPIYRIERTDDIDKLDAVCETILETVRSFNKTESPFRPS